MDEKYGTLCTRRPKGKKLTFMCGGIPLSEAHKYIVWKAVEASGDVIIFVESLSGEQFQITREGVKK